MATCEGRCDSAEQTVSFYSCRSGERAHLVQPKSAPNKCGKALFLSPVVAFEKTRRGAEILWATRNIPNALLVLKQGPTPAAATEDKEPEVGKPGNDKISASR